MFLYDKNRASYRYSSYKVAEVLDTRDCLLKTAADILEAIDEIDNGLGIEKGAGIGSKIIGLAILGTLALPYWKRYIHGKHRRRAEKRLRDLQNRGLMDRIMNKDVQE